MKRHLRPRLQTMMGPQHIILGIRQGMYIKVIWLDFVHVGHHLVGCAESEAKAPDRMQESGSRLWYRGA
jgi:hypothetical protein